MNEEVKKLVAIGKLNDQAGKAISKLEKGTYCLHKSWGVGVITDWDLLGDRLTVDFEDKAGHSMKLEFAAKSLEAIEEDHVMAMRLRDPVALTELATQEPAAFAKKVLTSFGGSMAIDDWDDVVKGKVIPEGKFRSWWDSAKKAMRADRSFVVPSKRNLPLELRAEDVSPSEAMMEEFNNARDAKSKLITLENIMKDLSAFKGSEDLLQSVINDVSVAARQCQKMYPLTSIALIIEREELVNKVDGLDSGENAQTLVDVLRSETERMPEILKGMGTARQREVYSLFPEVYGEDEWPDHAFELLQESGARAIGELTKFLVDREQMDGLNAYLELGLQQRSLQSDLLAWICKERKKTASGIFGPLIGSAIVNSLERDHYEDQMTKGNRLVDILTSDTDLIPDLLADADRTQVRNFARRLKGSPVFEPLTRGSLLARIIKVFPDVNAIVAGEQEEGYEEKSSTPSGLIVSWGSLEARRATLENIMRKEIPANSEEIRIAREHGDLRENSEFKMAKEQQAVLMRRQAELEGDIAHARGTDFADADTSVVSIGTVVDIEDVEGGQKETFTILGAWDTNLEKGIISYLSGTAIALLNQAPGAEVSIPTEEADVSRKVKIVAIRPYNTATPE